MPKLLQAHTGVLLGENGPVASSLFAQALAPKPGRSQAASVASTPDQPTDARWIAYSSNLCISAAEDAQSSSGDTLPEQELPEEARGAAEHGEDTGMQDAAIVIPPVPHAAGELRMAALLADLRRPAEPSQPFWRCTRRLGLIQEINQLRGLPGPRAAAMDVRQRNLEMICMHPQWRSLLPWSLAGLCKGIADGQHDLKYPLTVDGSRLLVPLGTLCSLQPMQTFQASMTRMLEAVRASEGGRNRRAVRMIEHILPDISLLGIIHYNRSPQQVLAMAAEQTRHLTSPMHSAFWESVKASTSLSALQLQQARMLLDTRQRNLDDVAANEASILAALAGSSNGGSADFSSAELLDMTEDLQTAAALRVENDLSMVMALIHSVLTPFQTACFISASYPLICNWIALAKQLVAEPSPAQ